MGLFKRRPRANADGQYEATLFLGDEELPIVGESNYQEALEQICGGRGPDSVNHDCVAALIPEPNNLYDENAVSVHIDGHKVGHLSRTAAKRLQPGIIRYTRREQKVVAVRAEIRGGWYRGEGSEGSFGVFLFADWDDLR